ncbi:4-hydroxy-tetrahydrodipicolinate synthase [Aliidongia dinghuensis]|uniref:4-hydroxy-tetrahydrodipicolinate synthase n=1 Tax=Aliidongia dinghuensis TaxID=1867774 RepID=A0A8J2YYU7_9PROT|nr:dihydrodipicolinate synthase family protein [Aliidongia dinghuensis]GGF43048.1 4-hydroxy-tetrahydrodipicolinate synthase [Aliidongia dinghuensis]
MSQLQLRGLIPAFPTPLTADGEIDDRGLERIVEYQIAGGVSGLVPLGGTGEATALTHAQRVKALEVTVAVAAGRVPVIAGVLDAGFGGACDSARAYEKAGADGLMVIPPFYTRTDQSGLLRYFRALRKEVSVPFVLYDNPYRTHTVIAPETIACMAEEGLAVGMKASNTDLYHLDHVSKLVPDGFAILSGQDTLFVQQVILGASGGVLTSAALIPGYWANVQSLAEQGRVAEALGAQGLLNPLMDALFAEEFPTAVRAAFERIGLSTGTALPPVGALSEAALGRVHAAVDALLDSGVLKEVPKH